MKTRPTSTLPYDEGPIYHYTDAAGLIGLVQNHAIWATESSGMNDPREGIYGMTALKAYEPPDEYRTEFTAVREMLSTTFLEEVYVACCTTRRDDVSQWARYTPWPNVGYCIGIDPKVSLGVVSDEQPSSFDGYDRSTWTTAARPSRWARVAYGQDGFDQLVAQYNLWHRDLTNAEPDGEDEKSIFRFSLINRVRAQTSLLDITRLAKDEGFSAESEVRVVTTIGEPGKFVRNRASRYGVVRYVELAAGPVRRGFLARDDEDKDSWEHFPIESVTIGPSPFAERGKRSIELLLKENGYDVPVHLSNARMR